MLKILTYNVGLLRIKFFGRTVVEPAPYVDERYAHLAAALLASGADIIALQEIYDRGQQARLAHDLSDVYPYCEFSPTRPGRRLGAALMIFSKYLITDAEHILFHDVPFDERLFVDKGMIIATIKAGAFGTIRLANTHCTSGGAIHNPEGNFTNHARSKQYRQIFDTLNRDHSLTRFAIGDFNAGPEAAKENYHELQTHGYVSAWNACHQLSAPTWDPKNELNAHGPHRATSAQRMDHILFRDGENFQTKVKNAQIVLSEPCVTVPSGKVTISDHYGLMTELEK
jgi:endonuclease/exonuclease/phosphatase family metal-dependent hydrolase